MIFLFFICILLSNYLMLSSCGSISHLASPIYCIKWEVSLFLVVSFMDLIWLSPSYSWIWTYFIAVVQTGLEKNLFGNHPVSLPVPESRTTPPAFASDPLVGASSAEGRETNGSSTSAGGKNGINMTQGAGPSKLSVSDITEIEGPSSAGNFMKSSSPVGVRAFLISWMKYFNTLNSLFGMYLPLYSLCTYSHDFGSVVVMQPSLVLQHERVQFISNDKTQKFPIMLMMRIGIVRNTQKGVSVRRSYYHLMCWLCLLNLNNLDDYFLFCFPFFMVMWLLV